MTTALHLRTINDLPVAAGKDAVISGVRGAPGERDAAARISLGRRHQRLDDARQTVVHRSQHRALIKRGQGNGAQKQKDQRPGGGAGKQSEGKGCPALHETGRATGSTSR